MSIDAPIQDLDKTDVIAVRHDGGVDMFVVVSGPIDGSEPILHTLKIKLRNYIRELAHPRFLEKYPGAKTNQNLIVLVSEHFIHPSAVAIIEGLQHEAEQAGARIELRASA